MDILSLSHETPEGRSHTCHLPVLSTLAWCVGRTQPWVGQLWPCPWVLGTGGRQ